MPSVLPARPPDAQLLGYAALIDFYQLDGPPPRRLTALASVARSTTHWQNGIEWQLLPRNSGLRLPRPPIEHLGVALKHEGTDLRVLSRLFKQDIAQDLAAYVNANRFGLYTRRAWFLYEWLTGRRLAVEEPHGAQYVPAIDPTQYHAHPLPAPQGR